MWGQSSRPLSQAWACLPVSGYQPPSPVELSPWASCKLKISTQPQTHSASAFSISREVISPQSLSPELWEDPCLLSNPVDSASLISLGLDLSFPTHSFFHLFPGRSCCYHSLMDTHPPVQSDRFRSLLTDSQGLPVPST